MVDDPAELGTGDAEGAAEGAEISVLDRTLWSRFRDDLDVPEFARVWLALQVRLLGGAERGVVVLLDGASEDYLPVASWPDGMAPGDALAEAVETSLDRGSSAVAGRRRAFAAALTVDDNVLGAVGVMFREPPSEPESTLRQLTWGSGWLISALRRRKLAHTARERAGMSTVLDAVGAAHDERTARNAFITVANLLTRRLDAEQVAIGLVRRRRTRLQALSDASDFKLGTTFTSALERAMTETADQGGSILFPRRRDQAYMITTAHEGYARQTGAGDVMSIPLLANGTVFGVISFQKRSGAQFADPEIVAAEAAAAALGPVFFDKLHAERSGLRVIGAGVKRAAGSVLGRDHLGRKIALLAVAIAAVWLAVATGEFRVRAQAEVQGEVVRSLTASFDGHVLQESARAGDTVSEGEVIARLDDRDLLIELMRWETELGRYQGEYDLALAESEAGSARIAQANIAQSRAKIELVSRQISRADVLAPFSGVVIEGDLSQAIGAPVRRGEELFKIAPLDSYRVAIEVEERDLDEIVVGQTGQLVLASLPQDRFRFEINKITPRLDARDGRNFAIVEARMEDRAPEVRPGMRGIAKISIDERHLVRIWTQPMIDWFRLAFWRWMP